MMWTSGLVSILGFIQGDSFSALISREGYLLTLLSSFSAGEIVSMLLKCLLTLSALLTSLDNTLLSSPMVLLGSCSLTSEIFQINKLKNLPLSTKNRPFHDSKFFLNSKYQIMLISVEVHGCFCFFQLLVLLPRISAYV